MSSDDRFDRLDNLARELKEVTGVHLADIEANDGEDEIIAHADVGGVRVLAWRDEDGDLNVYSEMTTDLRTRTMCGITSRPPPMTTTF